MTVIALFIAQNNVRPALHFKILPPARALIASDPGTRINPRGILTTYPVFFFWGNAQNSATSDHLIMTTKMIHIMWRPQKELSNWQPRSTARPLI